MIDLDRVRADLPSPGGRIFLHSAGASLPPSVVHQEVLGHLRRETEVGGYRAADERIDDLERIYPVFAELLGAAPEEVAFTDSATRSWLALLDAVPLSAGDRLLVSEVEYGANAVALLRLAEITGARVELVPSDEHGRIDVAALRGMLDERVRLVSLVHVPTNGGLVNPVREVADAAHEVGALVLLDACQSVGQLPVRLDESGVDMLTGTGRKWLRGPRGTGYLAVRAEVLATLRPRLVDHTAAEWVEPWRYELRSDARVFGLWEYDVAGRLGLLRAAEYLLGLGVDEVAAAVADRADRLRAGLATVDGVRLRDLGVHRCGIVTFTVDGVAPAAVADRLHARDIEVGISTPEGAQFDMTRRGIDAMVRASPHYFVHPDEIDRTVEAVAEIARVGKGLST